MALKPLVPGFSRRLLAVAGSALAAATLPFMHAQSTAAQPSRVLFVVTSHDKIEQTGASTGFYLSEVSHPWAALVEAGYEVDFVSPKGGKAPVTGFDLTDPINRKLWENQTYRARIERTKRPREIAPDDYLAIHFAGGHGAMWDLPDDAALAEIAAKIYQRGGVVSAVCHGPAALVNIRLSSGKYLVDGKRINAFTNEEEAEVKLDGVVPFALESKLIARGGRFEKSAPWQPHTVSDQRLITGQNPQSAHAVGIALVEQLRHLEVASRLTRFAVKPADREKFQAALTGYVLQALAEDGNIQAEAYHEKEDRSVMWLIERWQNKDVFERFGRSPHARAVDSLKPTMLVTPAEIIEVTDLEPLSKPQWRRSASTDDTPLTIMLFVDARAGTQDTFRDVYHAVMPAFRGEPGVVTYQLSQLKSDETKFVTYEKFRSDEAFAFHLKFPPIQPVIDYLNTSIKQPPFQAGLHTLVEFAPLTREARQH